MGILDSLSYTVSGALTNRIMMWVNYDTNLVSIGVCVLIVFIQWASSVWKEYSSTSGLKQAIFNWFHGLRSSLFAFVHHILLLSMTVPGLNKSSLLRQWIDVTDPQNQLGKHPFFLTKQKEEWEFGKIDIEYLFFEFLLKKSKNSRIRCRPKKYFPGRLQISVSPVDFRFHDLKILPDGSGVFKRTRDIPSALSEYKNIPLHEDFSHLTCLSPLSEIPAKPEEKKETRDSVFDCPENSESNHCLGQYLKFSLREYMEFVYQSHHFKESCVPITDEFRQKDLEFIENNSDLPSLDQTIECYVEVILAKYPPKTVLVYFKRGTDVDKILDSVNSCSTRFPSTSNVLKLCFCMDGRNVHVSEFLDRVFRPEVMGASFPYPDYFRRISLKIQENISKLARLHANTRSNLNYGIVLQGPSGTGKSEMCNTMLCLTYQALSSLPDRTNQIINYEMNSLNVIKSIDYCQMVAEHGKTNKINIILLNEFDTIVNTMSNDFGWKPNPRFSGQGQGSSSMTMVGDRRTVKPLIQQIPMARNFVSSEEREIYLQEEAEKWKVLYPELDSRESEVVAFWKNLCDGSSNVFIVECNRDLELLVRISPEYASLFRKGRLGNDFISVCGHSFEEACHYVRVLFPVDKEMVDEFVDLHKSKVPERTLVPFSSFKQQVLDNADTVEECLESILSLFLKEN